MKTIRRLYRVHNQNAQEIAEQSAEVIRGYFANWDKRVKILVEPMPELPDGFNQDHTPYDVKIVTANNTTEKIAHAAGWAYISGLRDGLDRLRPLFYAASMTSHHNPALAEKLRDVSRFYQP